VISVLILRHLAVNAGFFGSANVSVLSLRSLLKRILVLGKSRILFKTGLSLLSQPHHLCLGKYPFVFLRFQYQLVLIWFLDVLLS